MSGVKAICEPASIRITPVRAKALLALALALGCLSFAAVEQRADHHHDDDKCGAFRIGVSAIGGCDGIGGKPTKAAILRWRLQH